MAERAGAGTLGRSPGSPLVRVVAILAAVALVGVAVAVLARDEAPTPSGPDQRVAERRFVNRQGDYAFRYPKGWEVSAQGTASKVVSPGGEVVISFGIGPKGKLEEAAARFASVVQSAYGDVQILGTERREIGGRPALIVAGLGTNASGVRIRFLAITVDSGRGNHSISVFVAEGSDPVEVLPPVQAIVASFRG